MQKAIINEVGEEMGLSPQQSQEMFDQYWMEYVIASLHSMDFDAVFVEELCTFSLRRNLVIKSIHEREKMLLTNIRDSYKENIEKEIVKLKKLLEYADKSNERRFFKKNYG